MKHQTINPEAPSTRGISFKQLTELVGSPVTVLVSLVLTYAGLVNKIDNSMKDINELAKGYQSVQVQMKELEAKQQTLEINILTLQIQLREKGYISNK